jgi:hypothetical protein
VETEGLSGMSEELLACKSFAPGYIGVDYFVEELR